MVNALTRKVGVTFGPIVLETLVKHYFERLRRDAPGKTQLRQDELLYDQAFNVVKVSAVLSVKWMVSYWPTELPCGSLAVSLFAFICPVLSPRLTY